ncbi:MAG: hypothetical protein N2483_08020 [Burkholderiaceae bacterium]|nr:hypothetical protein [Burkholderiaceae bacterium]
MPACHRASSRSQRLRCTLALIGALVLLPAPVWSEEDEPPPATVVEPAGNGLLVGARRGVRETLEWLARSIDAWFGDAPPGRGRITNGVLTVSGYWREREGSDYRVRLNARVRLPNVEERIYVFLGRDNERERVADTPAPLSRQDRLLAESAQDRGFFAGLGLALRRDFELRLGLSGIKPYAQARYRKPWDLSERDRLEFKQTFFWRVSDRLGSTTAVAYEHDYSPTLAVRWLTAATITQRSERYEWSSVLGAYQTFPALRLVSLELVGSGAQHTGVALTDYGVQVKWLQPVYRDWLLIELAAGHYWPRPNVDVQRSEAWAAGLALTMRF